MPSNFIIVQFSMIVLVMITFTIANNVPQATSFISKMIHTYDDERNPAVVFPDHYNNPSVIDDDSLSSEEHDNDDSHYNHLKTIWPELINKRYVNKVIRGDSRLWAIPYRFGKRAAMPYRFGKRAGMHFRLGKKSASL